MNITRENVDELNALLKVEIEKKDYQEKVDKVLADYRKKANMPGFRKGMVPMGIIKKQYGQSVLGEELNKVVSEALYDYINKEELEILGSPLPKNDIELKGDFQNPENFEMTYEIGISPKVDVPLSAKTKLEYTKVNIDEKIIDKEIDDLTRRYGKLVDAKEVGDKDLVICQLVELDENKAIKDGGVMSDSTISMEFVEDDQTKKTLLGKKVGDKVIVDPLKVSHGKHDASHLLNIKEAEVDNVSNQFQVTIKEIKVMEPAEMNQELFDKLFGKDNIKSEKELRERIKADLAEMFAKDSDRILLRRASNLLTEKTKINLPDEFLKRWIIASNKEPITLDEVNKDYENYTQGLKWELIQNTIFKNNDIKIEQEDVLNYTKGLLSSQYAQYGMPLPEDKELTMLAQQSLSNSKDSQQIYSMLGEQKLIQFLKETAKLDEKEVDYEAFVKIAKDPNA